MFVGETVAVLAFGISWFLKGSEIFNILREEHGLPADASATRPERVSGDQASAGHRRREGEGLKHRNRELRTTRQGAASGPESIR